jgi:hypothetical protein
MRAFRAIAVTFTLALTGAALAGPPASAAVPDASVHIHRQAFEGQRGTILASYKTRCAPGFEFAEAAIDFSQGTVSTPTTFGQSIPCDGRWHEQKTTSLEAFEPGPATMSVRLSVIRTDSGDPGKQGFESAPIFVRAAAASVIPATAKLLANHVVRLVLQARCDKPWLLQEFSINATQDEFPNQKNAGVISETYPPCDGQLHSRTFLLKADPGNFHKGKLRVDTSISLLDAVNFDPVTQANQTRMVAVQ